MDKILVDKSVLEKALEALEYENSWHEHHKVKPYVSTIDAITALRAALAQPLDAVTSIMLDVVPGADGEGVEIFAKTSADVVRKLTEMGQRIEELESCHSPRREWQSLTDTDMARVFRAVYGGARFGPSEKEFAIAVEDALKVKNNR